MVIEYYIGDDFWKLIKNEYYEPIICNIMNDSSCIFPNQYIWNQRQSNGEADFIDITTKQVFDAKLLFSTEMCRILSKRKLEKWVNDLTTMGNEIYEQVMKGNSELSNTIFHNEMIYRLSRINDNENCILFFPFSITSDLEDSLLSAVSNNIFEVVYNTIAKTNEYLRNKEVFIIYPNIENKIIIADLNNGHKEYLKKDYLSQYVKVNNIIIDKDKF